jgi:hypothetical protein
LKPEKQQAIGWRRASMMRALGSIRWIRPTWKKLFGILSMKNGAPVLRWMRVCRGIVRQSRSAAGASVSSTSGTAKLPTGACGRSEP